MVQTSARETGIGYQRCHSGHCDTTDGIFEDQHGVLNNHIAQRKTKANPDWLYADCETDSTSLTSESPAKWSRWDLVSSGRQPSPDETSISLHGRLLLSLLHRKLPISHTNESWSLRTGKRTTPYSEKPGQRRHREQLMNTRLTC